MTEGIPIVVVTAFGRDGDIQLAKEVGADWFVKKPFEKVPLEALGRIFNLPVLAEGAESVPLEAVKTKFIEVLNGICLADKFMLVEDPDMYILQVIGCKHAGTYHHSIQGGSFLCPHALFVGALIHTYVNPKIQVSKTVLKKGGSITVYKKPNVTTKKYITKTG